MVQSDNVALDMPSQTSLVGEPLAVDLVNTRTATTDRLATLDELRSWLAQQADRFGDAAPADVVALDAADLAAVRDLREAVADALAHLRRGDPPPVAAVERINDAQRAAPAIREVTAHGRSVTVVPVRSGPPGARLVAALAEAAADLLASEDVGRLRECAADDCVMLFVAANPRRRWCTPDICGNRARVARHYRRHKPG